MQKNNYQPQLGVDVQAVALDEHCGPVPLSNAVVADDDARLLVVD